MRRSIIGRSAVLALSTLILTALILLRCMNQSAIGEPANVSKTSGQAATPAEKRDPCAVPTTDPMFVQTSTAMIEGTLTVSCYNRTKKEEEKAQRVIRNVIVDDSDTTHTTFEQIWVSQGTHVVKLSGKGYAPPCHFVQISDESEHSVEFSLVGAQ